RIPPINRRDRSSTVNHKTRTLLGIFVVVGALTAACGSKFDGGDKATAGTTQTSAMKDMATGADTGASQLRAGLTALLEEHVYLPGITTGEALAGHDFTPAAAALEANTQGLQDAVASVYGQAGGTQFGDLWRKHIGFFVDYTTGRATKDQAKIA